jgi:hypothetical protein
MERQRLAEWEKQRKAELMQHRQREQEKVLILKAKQDHINIDLEKLVSQFFVYLLIVDLLVKSLKAKHDHINIDLEKLASQFFPTLLT